MPGVVGELKCTWQICSDVRTALPSGSAVCRVAVIVVPDVSKESVALIFSDLLCTLEPLRLRRPVVWNRRELLAVQRNLIPVDRNLRCTVAAVKWTADWP